MNPTKSASYRRPRESGGPGQQYRHINHLASTSGRRFAARPWVPAFAGTTTEIQHIGKHQFISGQALRMTKLFYAIQEIRHPEEARSAVSKGARWSCSA